VREAASKTKSVVLLVAARALKEAQREAQEQTNAPMDRALEAVLATLSTHAVEAGLRMHVPRGKKPGGRGKKTAAA
jgi:hypothetical protein